MAKIKKKMDFSVVGQNGLRHQNGRIDTEVHTRLRGGQAPKLYREMRDNDAVIGSTFYLVRTRIEQVDWRTTPADPENPEAQDWADFVESARGDMSHTWSDFISEALSEMEYGWSYFETVYKRRLGQTNDPTTSSRYDDGYIGWRKFAIRNQDTLDRWEFDEDQGIRGMWQLAPGMSQAVFIPIEKALLFRTEARANNPQGRSMLRNSVRSYLYLARLQGIEASGIERDLSGYPVMQVPLGMFEANSEYANLLETLKTIVTDIRRDEREGAIIPCERDADDKPTGFKFSLMSTGGQRAINLDQAVRRYESRIAMTLLAEFILLGTDKVGSFSMHASKTDVFAVALRALLKGIADVINRYAVSRLCVINGCPPDLIPTLTFGDIQAPPLNELVAFVTGCAASGMLMYDKTTEAWLRQQAGMPPSEIEALPGSQGNERMPDESQQSAEEESAAADMGDTA